MHKKIHLKNRKRKDKKKKKFLFFTLLIMAIAVFLMINFIGKTIGSKLMEYAKVEVGRIARYVVNYSVSSNNIKKMAAKDLFVVNKNRNDEIQTVDFDPVMINEILNSITENVINNFKAIESGNLEVINLSNGFLINTDVDKLKQGIITEIPIGIITDNALLSNLGPKLPVKLSIAGEIESYVDTKIDYYGINNALITVYVNINVSQQIYMPIAVDRIIISQKIPIAIKMMQGVVPNCYFGGLTTSSVLKDIVK